MILKLFVSVYLFIQIFASSALAGPDLKNAYYGKDFFQSNPGKVDWKVKIHLVLNGNHTRIDGDYDLIGPQCQSKGNCYRHSAVGYRRAREFLFGDFYLVKRGNQFGIKDVYCNRVAMEGEFRGEKPGPGQIPDHSVINAEHTWPQSHFTNSFPTEDQKSDMHHLFPTDSEMNSKRGSFPFGDVGSNGESLKCSESRLGRSRENRETIFEPPTQHKGNVARALFYFASRYETRISPDEERALREWHRLDPVDQEEMLRNERIFQLQKTRNPFVDFPELVEQVRDF